MFRDTKNNRNQTALDVAQKQKLTGRQLAENYDKIIVEEMNKWFPNLDGGLWFFDGYRKDLNTLSILGKKYYKF